MKRLLCGVALAGVLSGISVAAASKTQSSIILNVPAPYSGANAPIWQPRLGDTVNFTVNFPDSLNRYAVSIQILCYQEGTLVFATAGLSDRSFLLGGTTSPWMQNGGPATCDALLYYWSTSGTKFNVLASTEFDVIGLR